MRRQRSLAVLPETARIQEPNLNSMVSCPKISKLRRKWRSKWNPENLENWRVRKTKFGEPLIVPWPRPWLLSERRVLSHREHPLQKGTLQQTCRKWSTRSKGQKLNLIKDWSTRMDRMGEVLVVGFWMLQGFFKYFQIVNFYIFLYFLYMFIFFDFFKSMMNYSYLFIIFHYDIEL